MFDRVVSSLTSIGIESIAHSSTITTSFAVGDGDGDDGGGDGDIEGMRREHPRVDIIKRV